ncbi:hypothetical protein LOTGIDRAFT_73468, partial [Lottia gigantea]
KHLYNSIFFEFNTDILPVSVKDGVVLFISFHLISIIDLEEKEQTLITYGYPAFAWLDTRLTWNIYEHAGIEHINIPQSRIWIPDISVMNSVKEPVQLGYDMFRLMISNDGFVIWYPAMLIKSACDVNIRYYPLDKQQCSIQFASSPLELIFFNIINDTIILDEYTPNGQWELIETSVYFENLTTIRQIFTVNLTLKRRYPFYLLNMIIPIIILSCLGSLVFILPAASGEKMSLSTTVLLAYVVFLTIITDNMPHTSTQSPLLVIYLIVLVAMSASSVILSTIVLRVYHKD